MSAMFRNLFRFVLFVTFAISLGIWEARADSKLSDVAGAAYDFNSSFYNRTAPEGDLGAIVARFFELANAGDLAAAEPLGEGAIVLGGGSYEVWMALADVKRGLNKPLEAVYAAYLASDRAPTEIERAAAMTEVAQGLETLNRLEEALAAYDYALQIGENPEAQEGYRRLSEQVPFQVAGVTINTDSDLPSACIEFDRRVTSSRALKYEDFVRISPDAQVAYRTADNQLCIEGLQFASTYTAKLLKGLPAETIGKIAEDTEVQISIGDRPSSVGFQKQAYVLPKISSTGVPLTTVNMDYVKLRLLRINDRNLIHEVNVSSFLNNLYGWDAEEIADRSGEVIWEGGMAVEGEKNRRVTTSVPVLEMIPEIKPGLYVLLARPGQDPEAVTTPEEEYWDAYATQWIVISDIGLTTMTGEDGMNVFVRSLETAQPIARATVQLIARNNEILGTATTDRMGAARFDSGLLQGEAGRTATAVMVSRKDGDFSFLDITRSAYDLSDRGVGGRPIAGDYDLFFYTDRGVYRPGETVHLSALLRDAGGKAVTGLPVTLRLIRPDGVEATRYENLKDQLGGFQQDIEISDVARTGSWTVEAYIDPNGDPIAYIGFLVEEVVPARIETLLSPGAEDIIVGQTLTVAGEVKYLYGAPGDGLQVKSDLVIEPDYEPFPDFNQYYFGLEEETTDPQRLTFADLTTDAQGKFELPVSVDEVPDVQTPLKATLRVEAYEFSGRPVIESIELPIRNRNLWLGIKPLFMDSEVAEGAAAEFEILALDGQGQPTELAQLDYRLVREEWDYDWYFADGSWDYQVVIRDGDARAGKGSIAKGVPTKITESVTWGNYRLEVYDPATGTASSVRFHAGWSAKPGVGETPDRLQVVSDKTSYQAGESAEVMLRAPFAGEVLVAIATDRILETRIVSVPKEGKSIRVDVDAAWGAGAYVLATAFRPGENAERGPGRAVGVAWLAVDSAPRTIAVSMTVPEKVLPRGTVEIPVSVTNAKSDQTYLTLAAVDEGILTLTDFATPDPVDYIFGKKRLMVELRDLYGQLIDGKSGRRGQIREGGDGDFSQRGAPKKIELVALFSGIVKLDQNGQAKVSLNIPDYNGRLRLMAVAYDSENVGWGEAGLVVRDPVVAEMSAPRFLAPGDESVMSLRLQNVDGAAGRYEGVIESQGDVQMGQGATFALDLAQGGATQMRIPILGQRVGSGEIKLALKGPDGYALERSIAIPVRPAQAPITETLTQKLEPGQAMDLKQVTLDQFIPGTGALNASFSTIPNLDVKTVLESLEHYTYGCLEQTTSKAFPLLVAGDVADLWSLPDRYKEIDQKALEGAVKSVLSRQRYDGLFGLWTSTDPIEPWLSAYAMDFLMRAKEKGFFVSDSAFEEGLAGLQRIAAGQYGTDNGTERYGTGPSARSYAFYVLARAKQAKIADLRYWFDSQDLEIQSPLALAQLSAALAMNGDLDRAKKGFEIALDTWDKSKPIQFEWSYGSSLRDIAAIVTLMAENSAPTVDVAPWLDKVATEQSRRTWFSTQEQAWILRAAQSTAGKSPHIKLAVVPGETVDQDKAFLLQPEPASLSTGISVTNAGTDLVYAKSSATGVPMADLPASDQGFQIERRIYDAEGQEVALDQLRQNDMVVVVLTGRVTDGGNHQALLIDLLPAGLEIENANLANTRQAQELGFLPALTPANYVEYRDDRFVAAFDTLGEQGQAVNLEFAFAYIARAVTPGEYKLPAPSIEDMYKPERRGRGVTGRIVIQATN